MKKAVLFGIPLFVFLVLSVYAGGRKDQSPQVFSGEIRMATGGTTGTYYSFGMDVGRILTAKSGIPITVHSTGASKANIQLIDAGEAEMAIVQNDVMDYAWHGVDLFYGEKITGFLAMAGLYAEACQIVVDHASGIKTVADLKGKNVSVGDMGSGTEFNARQILEVYGIGLHEIRRYNLDFAASADALKENKIDAFFCIAGTPTIAVTELANSIDIDILEIDDDHADQLIRNYPFYTQFTIPARSYWGQYDAVKTVAVKASFIVSSALPDETVYLLTKTLFDNLLLIDDAHIKGPELSILHAVEGISIPFHPGALRYYREAGLTPVIPLRLLHPVVAE